MRAKSRGQSYEKGAFINSYLNELSNTNDIVRVIETGLRRRTLYPATTTYSSWMGNPFGHDGLMLKQFYLLNCIVCNWDVDLDACYALGGWARGQRGGGTGGGLIWSESYFFDNDDINYIFLYSCISLSLLNIHQFHIPLRVWCYFHVLKIWWIWYGMNSQVSSW